MPRSRSCDPCGRMIPRRRAQRLAASAAESRDGGQGMSARRHQLTFRVPAMASGRHATPLPVPTSAHWPAHHIKSNVDSPVSLIDMSMGFFDTALQTERRPQRVAPVGEGAIGDEQAVEHGAATAALRQHTAATAAYRRVARRDDDERRAGARRRSAAGAGPGQASGGADDAAEDRRAHRYVGRAVVWPWGWLRRRRPHGY